MTVRAVIGLFGLNAALLIVGSALLWAIRGWSWWTEVVRLAGVAYILGLASLMILVTLAIVLGIPISVATLVAMGVVLVLASIAVGRVRGHAVIALKPPGWRFPRLSLFAAMFVAGIVVYLEGLFRSERLSGVVKEWDSWAFWMPKAEWLYYVGGLDSDFLARLPGPSYPPGMTAVHAAAFHAMGSPDVVTLHSQHWFFAVGFVAAAAGLLATRVPHAILYPLLLAILVAPSLVSRMMTTYADVPLGYLAAIAALLIGLWLLESKPWHLVAATPLLAAMMLTKREGALFVACVLLAAFAATLRTRREEWPKLLAVTLVAGALSLPWRVWFALEGLPSDGPETGYLGSLGQVDRTWPALKLVVRTLFDQDLWPFVTILTVAAIVLAAIAGATRIAVYAGVLAASAIVAASWAIWSNSSLELTQDDSKNPVVRLIGTAVLVLATLSPLLLGSVWSRAGTEPAERPAVVTPGPDALVTRSLWAWIVVVIALASHPGAMLLGYSGSGLPGGMPRFPTAGDCAQPAVSGQPARLVLGYAESYDQANALRQRARAAGLVDTKTTQDDCGRVRVFVAGSHSTGALRGLVETARAAGLDPVLETPGRRGSS